MVNLRTLSHRFKAYQREKRTAGKDRVGRFCSTAELTSQEKETESTHNPSAGSKMLLS